MDFNHVFGVNDIRGKYPSEVNEKLAYLIGLTLPSILNANCIAVGHDMRLTSPALAGAVISGLARSGCKAVDIGLCGSEMLYFAVGHYRFDGGVMITASHNPQQYNGFKIVGRNATSLAGTAAWHELQMALVFTKFTDIINYDGAEKIEILPDYVKRLLAFINTSELKPMKVLANVGNGVVGKVLDALKGYLPMDIIQLYPIPDGSFPHGVPNPLLKENQAVTSHAVVESKADIGVAWDGDFDRCFFFDETGCFVESHYMVGLLAKAFLLNNPGASIVHDVRCVWNTSEIVRKNGGLSVPCRSGHALIKAKMREVNAVYGGEMSAHHYF